MEEIDGWMKLMILKFSRRLLGRVSNEFVGVFYVIVYEQMIPN